MAVETASEHRTPEPVEGLLHGVLVHAQTGPGRITGMDTAAAKATGAVVLTGQDTLGIDPYHGPVLRDRPVLAIDRVRYRGEPVAAVAAASADAARAAAAMIRASVEPLPARVTGAKPGDEPLVHLTDLLRRGALADQAPLAPGDSNLLAASIHPFGPTDGPDFPNRLIVVEEPARIAPGPMLATARWDDGGLSIWTTNTEPEAVQRDLAELFELEAGQIEVLATAPEIPLSLPGSLGIEAIAAALARRARTAVRLVADPAAFGWAGPRARLQISGAEALLTLDAGAVAGYLPLWLEELAGAVADAYGISSVSARVIYSEQPPVAATLADWQLALAPALPHSQQSIAP